MALVALSLTLLSLLHQVTSLPAVANQRVAAAWYAGFHANEGFPLSAVSWEKYDTLIYSFAITTPDVHTISLEGSNPSLLPDFVSECNKHGVAPHIALGGWTGGRWFSSNVATAENRTDFVETLLNFVKEYELEGIDFDWEYPAKQGIGCNVLSPEDTVNFLLFLQDLRADPFGATLTLSAATTITPFIDSSGHPSMDVSGFAEVLDYIAIMNYDIWGSWSSAVGPNSPLDDACAVSANQQGSAVSAVAAWNAAGMPSEQIVLGMAAYGRSYNVSRSDAFVDGTSQLVAYPKFNAKNQPPGDAWDDTGSVDVCGVYSGPGGTFRLWGLIDANFLTPEGTLVSGIYDRYDTCSQTPYVYNATSGVMVSFENAQSFAAKGEYILKTGLKGFSIWEAGGDYEDILLDSVRSAAGFGYANY